LTAPLRGLRPACQRANEGYERPARVNVGDGQESIVEHGKLADMRTEMSVRNSRSRSVAKTFEKVLNRHIEKIRKKI